MTQYRCHDLESKPSAVTALASAGLILIIWSCLTSHVDVSHSSSESPSSITAAFSWEVSSATGLPPACLPSGTGYARGPLNARG